MTLLETAYEYLNRDKIHHVDMLDPLDRGIGRLLYATEQGVLLYNETGCTYCISTESHEVFLEMCRLMGDVDMVCLHHYQFVDELTERLSMTGKLDVRNTVYPLAEPVEYTLPEGFSIKPMDMSLLPFVIEHYKNFPGTEYREERLQAGMLGAFDGENPAGFIGTHAEGSMGMLEILPEYRRHGLAYALEGAMINQLLGQGRTPYGSVVVGNSASEKLQKKLGLVKTDKPMIWLYK